MTIEEKFDKEFGNQPEICLQNCHPKEKKRLLTFIKQQIKESHKKGYLACEKIYEVSIENIIKTQKKQMKEMADSIINDKYINPMVRDKLRDKYLK